MKAQIFRKMLPPLGILLIGAMVFAYLKSSREMPNRVKRERSSIRVEALVMEKSDQPVRIRTMGTVIASQSVVLTPQVGGKIVYRNPSLIPGGWVKKGEVLVRLETKDFELAVRQQQGNVAQARLNLANEKGLKAAAEREWNLIREDVAPTEEGKRLALREIQMESAQAALESAEGMLEKARLDLSRTRIKAPFNAVVAEEFVEEGQVLSTQSSIARLVSSDAFHVDVSVPLEALDHLQIPGIHGDSASPARVMQKTASGRDVYRPAELLRLLPDLDARGKMARLLVDVKRPFDPPKMDPAEDERSNLPLLLGDYVEVIFEGRTMERVFLLPRKAVRDGDTVWLFTPDGTLDIRKLDIAWTRGESVLTRDDFLENAVVVTSRIKVPVQGMRLERIGENRAELPDAEGGAIPTDESANKENRP